MILFPDKNIMSKFVLSTTWNYVFLTQSKKCLAEILSKYEK